MAVVRLSKRLWNEYLHQVKLKQERQAAENALRQKREQLIVEHMPVARAIARQVFHRFRHAAGGGNSKISFEDFISASYVGLVEAAGRWEPSKGDFAKYCYFRVRGAIIDAHRRQAYNELLPISLDELADEEAGGRNERGHGGRRAGRDFIARYLADKSATPDELAGDRQARLVLVAVIERVLPDEERDVIRQALAGKNVTEIAKAHGQSPLWARAKLAAAREKVAREVQRRVA
jgi:RNA polymerase sigma factor (sigma-70 family)